MSKYKGLFTFDEDNHRYVPIAQADGIIDTMDYEPDSKPSDPLIKDEKIRKAVKVWAELNNIKEVAYIITGGGLSVFTKNGVEIDFTFQVQGVQDDKHYTITELCGEGEE